MQIIDYDWLIKSSKNMLFDGSKTLFLRPSLSLVLPNLVWYDIELFYFTVRLYV